MPTYGYRCQSCNAEFEIWQRITDPSGADCPHCGGAGTRLFYPAGIVFKGSGFHKTDYRSGSGSSSDKSTRSSPSKSEGQSGGDSGSAPSSKPSSGDKQ